MWYVAAPRCGPGLCEVDCCFGLAPYPRIREGVGACALFCSEQAVEKALQTLDIKHGFAESPLWQKVLSALRESLGDGNFETWIAPLHPRLDAEGHLTFLIPNRFYADWVGTHYQELIASTLASQGFEIDCQRIAWQVDPSRRLAPPAVAASKEKKPQKQRVRQESRAALRKTPSSRPTALERQLNPEHCFSSFVVGPTNQLAHAASAVVAQSPGERYNPLFIYGGVGLGKTHLLNAIGNELLSKDPDVCVRYLSAEHFTNEFIFALRNNEIDAFRTRYRVHCDALLIDDIQFLAGREQTQEEFFHTFNSLHQSGRQIVVTSDVEPHRIAGMQERLISRFQSGLVADTQPPDLDLRVAILLKKAEQEKYILPQEVALCIAQRVQRNVRELEGTLTRLIAQSQLEGQPIDMAMAMSTLPGTQLASSVNLTAETVQRLVCDHFRLRLIDLRSAKRSRTLSYPRMIAMYLCRENLKASYVELGDTFGGRDHSSVLAAVRKVSRLIASDDDTQRTVDVLQQQIDDLQRAGRVVG